MPLNMKARGGDLPSRKDAAAAAAAAAVAVAAAAAVYTTGSAFAQTAAADTAVSFSQ